jgi:hypothetical protein
MVDLGFARATDRGGSRVAASVAVDLGIIDARIAPGPFPLTPVIIGFGATS